MILLAPGCNAVRYGAPTLGSDPVTEELVLALDPVDLPAGADHHLSPQPAPLHARFPSDGWAQGFVVEVVDTQGNTVDHGVLHHVKVLVPGRRELFHPIALRLVGAGAETRSASVPSRAGVPLAMGDSLLVTAMVHNPTDRDLEGVRIRVRLRYVPDEPGARIADIYPFFLHVTAPDEDSDYDLPPGWSERSWVVRPAVGGRILALGGHLHRYGTELRLEDASTGAVIWETRPILGPDGNVLDIPRRNYVWTRGPRLDPARHYRVVAAYHNPTGDTLPGAGMGTVGGILRPEGPWPDVDPRAPLYLFDLERELQGHAHGDGMGHQHH